MSYYIGLACTCHDPAIAVVNPAGQVVFAEATERHLQAKRAIHQPPDHLPYISTILERFCDPEEDLVAAKTWSPRAGKLLARQMWVNSLGAALVRDGSAWAIPMQLTRSALVAQTAALALVCEGLRGACLRERHLGLAERRLSVTGFDHHLTHAATGCLTSPFDDAVCAVIDGFGEGSSTAYYRFRRGTLEPLGGRTRSYNSLGLFYLALCAACGFDPVVGEEWKVMGLAPHGRRDDRIYSLFKSALRVDGLRIRNAPQQYACPVWREPVPADPADLAHTGQLVFEECMTELLRNLHALGLSDNLVLTGGCALNSSFNGKILERTGFRRLHVFSAPADDGNALGAALLAFRRDHPDHRFEPAFHSPYLGEEISADRLRRWAETNAADSRLAHRPGAIHEAAARLLAEGKIVGWIQGRAEFGPRALGNRSILADPRQPGMKDRINSRVKYRENFRPFAPAILHEHGHAFFENYQESPYMERTLRFRPETVARVPAVVHVDRTGRLQTVKKEWNGPFHRLLESFHAITSVPVLLNTSLNVMGKPIVHSLEDALAMFAATGLDALVVGDYVLEKR